MLRNVLKVTLRNLRKHILYAGINVVGLALGLACCVVIALYVLEALSYDRFHDKVDRIVRLVEDQEHEDGVSRLATTYGPLAPALEEEMASVEHAVRVLPYSLLVSRDVERRRQEDRFVFVDSTFFDVFSVNALRGDVRTALAAPFSVVLTASTSRRYFGGGNPIGQTLEVRDDETTRNFTVTAVVADPPHNTHLPFDFLASFASIRLIYGDWIDDPRNWEHPPLYTYALLADGATVADLEARLPTFARRHMGETRTANRQLRAERLTDIHLYSRREQSLVPGSDITYVYLFSLIAFITVLIGCVNFTNLTTARAMHRAKEVAMRRALGANRRQLVLQFLAESTLLVILALVTGLLLARAALPSLSTMSGEDLSMEYLAHWSTPLIALAGIGFVSLLAGSYPAFFLSGAGRAGTRKGDGPRTAGSKGSFVRSSLVVFQFVVSIGLMISTLVVYRQVDYVRNERLGFDKKHVVLVPLRDLENQFQHTSLKDAWQELPGVEAVSASSGMPGLGGGIYDWWVHPEHRSDSLRLMVLTVDHDYAKTYGLNVLDGRDFSEQFATDANEAFLLNESAVKRLGWTDAVGKEVTLDAWFRGRLEKRGSVVGVVEDFQYRSLHHAIDPILFHILPDSWYYDYVSARIRPGDITGTLEAMEQIWHEYNAERPFEYTFLDDQVDALYRAEARVGRLFGAFAALAVGIACLGLLGLAALTAAGRTREIGIRKVLGASVSGIVLLLSREFVGLVLVASILATPMAYLAMRRWLDGFAYRVPVGADVFVLTIMLALFLALITVSFQSVRAALADPVKTLRHE